MLSHNSEATQPANVHKQNQVLGPTASQHHSPLAELRGATHPIPSPCSTAAQCFVKPSWADHALPCPRSGPGTHGPSLLMFKASLLGALTWRVMEEVDYTLLGCVEEGSGHGVVLSISTEKLKRQDKKELEVAGKVGYVPARSSSRQGRHLQHPSVSSPVSETQQGLCPC